MKNAIPYASGIITATAQTIAEIILAIIIDASGLPMEISEDMPTSMITDNASTSSMNGQINTIRSSDAAAAPDLLRSETRRCRAVAAQEMSIITSDGSQSHLNISSELPTGKEPSNTNHERYVRGSGRSMDDAIMDVAGRNCGPQTADHHFPHSSSESLRIMAGEITAEMNAGVRIRAAARWLPISVFDRVACDVSIPVNTE